MIRLVFLSYGKLTQQINHLLSAYPPEIEFEIIDTTIDNVLAVAEEIEKQKKDCVFISSGANAEVVQESRKIKTPLVEIQSTGYDLLAALNRAMVYSDCVGVISFKRKLPYLSAIKNVLRVNVVERIYSRLEDLSNTLDECRAMGIYDVVSGSLAGELAAEKGMRCHLLWSEPAIRFAIDHAIRVARVRKETQANAEWLKAILNFTHEGIVTIDRKGDIEIFNASAEKITGISARNAIGRNIAEVLGNMELESVIRDKQEKLNQIQEIGDTKILTNQVPIIIQNEAVGALATFQHIDIIQKAEEKIRRNLYTKGFIAETRFEDIIGKSKVMENVKKEAALYAKSDSTILIKGESGTGKDLFAQSIHNASARENKPFVAINCAALPLSLLESELFGYEEGAFTGAKRGGKRGVFELAHEGTLFLDEISEISMAIQAQLLRVLEKKEVLRIGGQKILKVDVRIIAATNKDLWQLVQEGKFREDLYYRLNVLELRLPPLRKRMEDIPLLTAKFLQENRQDIPQDKIKRIANCLVLREYNYPGNVRELKNIIERFSVLYNNESDAKKLMEEVMFLKKSDTRHANEKTRLLALLDECNGNKTKVAQKVGVSRTTIWRKLKECGIE
jgi:propionate catabolism operon transcriptional regulator